MHERVAEKAKTPVLMLGLDGTDAAAIRPWIDAGKLPALAALQRRGCFGALRSTASHYAGGVWSNFYTGQDVPWHGIYHSKLWRPEAMRCEVPTDRWLSSRPFWERLSERGYSMCVADVPMVLGKPRPLNGIYLGGWGTHDLISKGSWPADLWAGLRRKFGAPIMPAESFGAQSAATLMKLRDSLLRTAEQMQSIACDLLSQDWDFACIVFGATHRVGHYLWDLSQINETALTSSQRAVLSGALLEVYQATDHTIGRILEHVGNETLVMAFSAHGMGPNSGWGDLVPDILDVASAAADGAATTRGRGLLYRLKRQMPIHWVRPVLRSLPSAATERLLSLWSARMFDWKITQRFPLPMDAAGYMRVNLRGRERDGVVDEGDEYEEVCATLAELFESLRDRDTGQQIAPTVIRAYSDAPADAPCRALVPDLVVPWEGPFATGSREVISDALPWLHYKVPARMPSGRSGNHTDGAWFIAAGPGIRAGTTVAGHSILDLAPTVMRSLGTEPLPEFQGTPIAFQQAVGRA